MSELEVIKHQPNFPNEDLAAANVPFMKYYLQEGTEVASQTRQLGETLRPIHLTAHHALQLSGIEVKYTPNEYDAFCKGFATFEYASLMVKHRFARQQLVVGNVHRLFTSSEALPEIELADNRQDWMETYPNVNDVLFGAGRGEGEELPELYSRSMGAQVAWELQRG